MLVLLWLQRPQTPLIPCPNLCLESGVQGVGVENGITGPEVPQPCTAQHTQKLESIEPDRGGKTTSRFNKGTRALVVVGMTGRAVIPISLPSVPGPNTHTHTQHTHSLPSLQQKALKAAALWACAVREPGKNHWGSSTVITISRANSRELNPQ